MQKFLYESVIKSKLITLDGEEGKVLEGNVDGKKLE